MQTQDAPAEIIFKFWPWLEANQKRLIIGTIALVVVFFGWFFFAKQKEQAEITAGQDYTVFQTSQAEGITPKQAADGYLKIGAQYAGTKAGQRAWLQAGVVLFSGGNYADALAVFQNFLKSEAGSTLAPAARLGVASCLEAQGKLDEAVTAYRAVATGQNDTPEAMVAKFSQGRVLELQGKLSDAVSAYQEVARSPLAGSLANDAAQRVALLQTKLAVVKPAAKS
jgi:predicted negative regulator of RcsB-dependent stress response